MKHKQTFFLNCFAFSMIQQMLPIWSLVPLPLRNPAFTSESSQFMYCWSLTQRSFVGLCFSFCSLFCFYVFIVCFQFWLFWLLLLLLFYFVFCFFAYFVFAIGFRNCLFSVCAIAVFFVHLFLLFVLELVCCLFCFPFIQPHMVSRFFIPRLRVRSKLLGREHWASGVEHCVQDAGSREISWLQGILISVSSPRVLHLDTKT